MPSQEQPVQLPPMNEHEFRQEMHVRLGFAIGGGACYLAGVGLTLGLALIGETGSATAMAGLGSVSAIVGVDGLEAYVTGRRELREQLASGSE